LIDCSNGGFAIPFSVIIPEISSGGVISKAGLITFIPSGAVFLSPIPVTSLGFLCSIMTSSGLLSRSNVDSGAATYNGILCCFAIVAT